MPCWPPHRPRQRSLSCLGGTMADQSAILSAVSAQTALEVLHWRLACEALQDLDAVAAPQAWASLETYLRHQVRDRLGAIVAGLVAEAVVLERRTAAGHDVGDIRRELL